MKALQRLQKSIVPLFVLMGCCYSACSQSLTGDEVLAKFTQKIETLSSLQYTIHSIDTLVEGRVQKKSGEIILMRYADQNLPFRIYGKDDAGNESTFSRGQAVSVYHQNKEFEYHAYTAYREIIGTQVGQLVPSEILIPETPYDPKTGLGYTKLDAVECSNEFVLMIYYRDNQLFGIKNRFKKITIDKRTWIPVSYYHKFDTPYGEKQVDIRELTNIRVNDSSIQFPVINTSVLVGYHQVERMKKAYTPTYQQLLNTPFIDMNLKNMDGTMTQLSKRKGKVILLAFWETWCSPCIESIPRIKGFVDKYSPEDFEVWGIASDEKTFAKVPTVVKRTGISYPVYYGNEQTKKDYRVTGVPEYVIIDQAGKIVFIKAGFSDEIEKTLDALLK